jgi:hypothetical protein
MFCLLCQASTTSQQGDEDKAPPERADVESEKLPSDVEVVVPSKHVGSIDVDKAGDISQDDDADDPDGQGSDRKGSDIDDDGLESDASACEPESGSSDADDLGEDEDHQIGPAEESSNASDAQNDADMTAAEKSTKDADDPVSDRLLRQFRVIAGVKEAGPTPEINPDKLEDVDAPELADLRLKQ